MQKLIDYAGELNSVDKDTFLSLYQHLLMEQKDPIYSLEYLIIKSIDSRLARRVIKEGDSVLNIGCGFPINEIMFKSWGAKRVVGIDIDNTIIKRGKRWLNDLNLTDIELYVGSALEPNFPEKSFDVVVSFSAIEHVQEWQNYEKWIENMSKIAKRNVVLTTSNKKNLPLYFLSRFHKDFEYFFTPRQIKELFEKYNLKIVSVDTNTLWYSNYIPFIPSKLKLNKYTLRFDLLIEKMRRFNILKERGGRMGFIAKKLQVKEVGNALE